MDARDRFRAGWLLAGALVAGPLLALVAMAALPPAVAGTLGIVATWLGALAALRRQRAASVIDRATVAAATLVVLLPLGLALLWWSAAR